MPSAELAAIPAAYETTRASLHAVAEHVLARARYEREQRIGLGPTHGGFGTPVMPDGVQLRVDGTQLVRSRDGHEERAALTTLGAAAAFADTPLGAPEGLYPPATPADADTRLALDDAAAAVLGEWYAFVAGSLDDVATRHPGGDPSPMQLWPEHFDLALELGSADAGTRANFGGSPGDGAIAEPYLYVGPWDEARRVGLLGTHPWGAACTYSTLRDASDATEAARQFFSAAAHQLLS